MEQAPIVYSVEEITRKIANLLHEDFPSICVEGEISNYSVNSSGHAYLTLKDEKAQLSAVIFRSALSSILAKGIKLEDGAKVRAYGSLDFFGPWGRCQLLIRKIETVGNGDLMARYLELKDKLEKEGLFDPAKKRKLPFLPKRIGVITSPTGAVIHDIINVLSRRFPQFQLLLAPVRVQGKGAEDSICHAIRFMNENYGADSSSPIDLLIVGRGGGSLEDLWCFNEECVARAVAASKIPIISAVGHETDFTLCDFAADKRAPTPSAAAELAMPVKQDLEDRLEHISNTLRNQVFQKFHLYQVRVDAVLSSPIFKNPSSLIEGRQQMLDFLGMRLSQSLKTQVAEIRQRLLKIGSLEPHLSAALHRAKEKLSQTQGAFSVIREKKIGVIRIQLEGDRTAMIHAAEMRLERQRQQLSKISEKLSLLNPMGVVDRGYTLTKKSDGTLVRSLKDVEVGETIQTVLQGGVLKSKIEEKKND